MQEKTLVKSLWNGDRFSTLEGDGGVYVIKTYRKSSGSALTVRAERRLTEMTTGRWGLGLGKRWKAWDELNTPIEDQSIGQEVVKVRV